MSARLQALAFHRLTIPAWMLTLVVAAVLAVSAAIVVLGSGGGDPSSAAAAGPHTAANPAVSCVDTAVVGHC